MPNKTNIKKWVDALRSNEFEQATGSLRVDTEGGPTYCCLGVACELYKRETGKDGWKPNPMADQSNDKKAYGFFQGNGFLPATVARWLGVNKNPKLRGTPNDFTEETATELNDGFLLSFDEIADAIERKYLSNG